MMVKQYRGVFDSPSHVCVYNIADDRHSRLRMKEPVAHEWLLRKDSSLLVAAGTLTTRKGFADLIRAMKELLQRRYARMLILGDDPLRSELEALIVDLGLSDTVRSEGYVENPLKFFARADVFVLSSHVQGMPNVRSRR